MKEECKKQKTKKKKKNKGDGSYSERVRDKWFCWAFKSGFLQLICKASLIFKRHLTFITLNYHISAICLKINFQNFAKSFVKKMLTLS